MRHSQEKFLHRSTSYPAKPCPHHSNFHWRFDGQTPLLTATVRKIHRNSSEWWRWWNHCAGKWWSPDSNTVVKWLACGHVITEYTWQYVAWAYCQPVLGAASTATNKTGKKDQTSIHGSEMFWIEAKNLWRWPRLWALRTTAFFKNESRFFLLFDRTEKSCKICKLPPIRDAPLDSLASCSSVWGLSFELQIRAYLLPTSVSLTMF